MTVLSVAIGGTAGGMSTAVSDGRLRFWTRATGLVAMPALPRDGFVFGGKAKIYERVRRPGRKPLLIFSEKDLETVSFACKLRFRDGRSVLPLQRQLEDLAGGDDPVVARFAARDWGTWRITGLAITEDEEWKVNGHPTLSMADIELTEDVQASAVVGPLRITGGGKGFAR